MWLLLSGNRSNAQPFTLAVCARIGKSAVRALPLWGENSSGPGRKDGAPENNDCAHFSTVVFIIADMFCSWKNARN